MKTTQLSWKDSKYTAVLSTLGEEMDQCSVQNDVGAEVAHLFLLRAGLAGLVDVEFRLDLAPDDGLCLVIGRVVVEHKLAAREGRSLV